MYRIFVVEDDAVIASAVQRHLESWGYQVACAVRFDDVLSDFAAFDPQLVLLDISLPFFNGYHWCREIRKVSKVPILFLTSASDDMNLVMAMEMGGDDLLAKPFHLQVLSAKVQAMLRRAYDFAGTAHLLSCGGAVLNVSDGTLTANGQKVELTRNEFKILQLLLEHRGEIVSREAIMGESGSGKTTLLNILAALDRPTAGEVFLNGKALSDVREGDLAAFRRSHLGFVFQDFNLLDIFSLRDNIFLPLVLAGRPYEEMERKLKPLAEQLGIADILIKYPYEVSGGQKQRAAVARALITDPQIVLADEPTGALDSRSSDNLLELFGEINKGGQTILMVTHSVKAASHAGRVLFLRDGRVYHQLYRGSESREAQFRRISDTLTVLTQGGENHG